MEMHDLLKKISELSTLTESKESTETSTGGKKTSSAGVTTHKGKYGTEYQGDEDDEDEDGKKKPKKAKAADEPKRGRGRPKKNADASGNVPKYANASALQSFMVGNLPKDKKGKTALPGKASKKHSLKEWFDEIDAQVKHLAENTTANTTTTSTTPSSTQQKYKVVNNPNGSKEVVDTTDGLSREYPPNVANQATIDATKMNAQAQKDAQNQQQNQAVTQEGEGDTGGKKWIKGAIKKPGAFSKKAASHGKSTGEFASDVLANKEKYPAKTLSKLGKKAKSVKEAQPESNDSTLSPLSLGAKIDEAPEKETSAPAKAKAKKGSWKNSLREAAKPDFPDVDDDGNRKESIKSAAASAKAKKKPVKEGSDSCRAAYHEGKCHAFENGHYRCRYDEGMEERGHYHRGFMEGLEECYGGTGGMVGEAAGGIMPSGGQINNNSAGITDYNNWQSEVRKRFPDQAKFIRFISGKMPQDKLNKSEYNMIFAQIPGRDQLFGEFDLDKNIGWVAPDDSKRFNEELGEDQFMAELDALDEEMEGMDEGWNEGVEEGWNADMEEMKKGDYMKQQARKTPGPTFKAFGQTMHDKDVLEGHNDFDISEDPMLESWDKQLNQLLNEGAIKEGLTVSTSTGQQGMPDSVSISASDADAQKLMDLLKMSGIGAPAQASSEHGHDGSMGAISAKITQIAGHDEADYEQETDAEHCEPEQASGDPHSDVENGHRATDIMTMPLGKHFSQNVEPEEIEIVEPYDHDEVIHALDFGDEMKRITNKLVAIEAGEQVVKESSDAPAKSKPPVLAMPAGSGFSKQAAEDDPHPPEAYEHDDVMGALSDGGSKKSKSTKQKVDESELPMPAGSGFSDPNTKDTPAKEVKPDDFDGVLKSLSKDGGKEQEDDGGFSRLKSMLQAQWGKSSSKKEESKESVEEDASKDVCVECGGLMEEDHKCQEEAVEETEKLDEWANTRSAQRDEGQLGRETFVANEEYMLNGITGGLNGKKAQRSHGYRQNDNPLAMKENMPEDGGLADWLKLSGIR